MTKQTLSKQQIDEIETAIAAYQQHAPTGFACRSAHPVADHAEALVAEVRRLRDELDRRTEDLAFLERTTLPETRRDIQHHQDGKQRWRERAERAEAALTQIRHLHKDSPMGPCPVCIDADAVTAGGDGLMPYPCPTGRLAGAQDCDPPQRPAPALAVPAGDGQQQ